jgi:hypothetical protein
VSRIVQLIKRDKAGNDLFVLDIHGPNMFAQGVGLTEGLDGIFHAPRTATNEQSAFIPGSRPGFDRVEERIVKIPVVTRATDTHDWEWVDSLLWHVCAPSEYFVLRIYSLDGTTARELTLRRVLAPEPGRVSDPGSDGKMKWIIIATAHDPWWYGDELTDAWTKGTSDGNGVLHVYNPTKQDTYLKFSFRQNQAAETWTIPDALGVYPEGDAKAGQRVFHTMPTIPTGSYARIDTFPIAFQWEVDGQAQAWSQMRAEQFTFPLEAGAGTDGELVELPVKVVGGTASSGVKVYVPTPYDTPWGW